MENSRACSFISFFFVFLFVIPVGSYGDIRIGATISKTGKYKEPANMLLLGYKLWQKEVNEKGGLLGQKVTFIIYDDESKPQKSAELYRKLIEKDKVDLVLSPYSSSITYAVSAVTEKYHYPLLAAGASALGIWKRGFRYVFGVYALADRYFIGFLDTSAEYGLKKLTIICENSRFPLDAAGGAKKWAKRFGLKVSSFITYPPGKPHFVNVLKQIRLKTPDAIILSAYPDDVYNFIRIMNKVSYKPRAFAATIAPVFKDFGKRLGKEAEGVFGPSQWEANSRIPYPGTKNFIRKFKMFTGHTPTYHAASAYAACEILEMAVKASGLDREKIRNTIRATDTFTVLGRFKIDQNGVQIGHNPVTIQWQNGKREIIWPRRMQTARPKFN